jgi:hypothetical protein
MEITETLQHHSPQIQQPCLAQPPNRLKSRKAKSSKPPGPQICAPDAALRSILTHQNGAPRLRSDPTKPPEPGRADGSTRRLGDPVFATLTNHSPRLEAQDERQKEQRRNGMDPAAQGGAARRTLHARTRYGRQQLRSPWERRREGAAVNDRRRSRARGREGKGFGGGLIYKVSCGFLQEGVGEIRERPGSLIFHPISSSSFSLFGLGG